VQKPGTKSPVMHESKKKNSVGNTGNKSSDEKSGNKTNDARTENKTSVVNPTAPTSGWRARLRGGKAQHKK
jgi:hypothetical protein